MTVFMVIVKVKSIPGSTMDLAIERSVGAEALKDYLEHKMPAGSPVVIDGVVQV